MPCQQEKLRYTAYEFLDVWGLHAVGFFMMHLQTIFVLAQDPVVLLLRIALRRLACRACHYKRSWRVQLSHCVYQWKLNELGRDGELIGGNL